MQFQYAVVKTDQEARTVTRLLSAAPRESGGSAASWSWAPMPSDLPDKVISGKRLQQWAWQRLSLTQQDRSAMHNIGWMGDGNSPLNTTEKCLIADSNKGTMNADESLHGHPTTSTFAECPDTPNEYIRSGWTSWRGVVGGYPNNSARFDKDCVGGKCQPTDELKCAPQVRHGTIIWITNCASHV